MAAFLGLKELGPGTPYLESLLGAKVRVVAPTAWLPMALGFGAAVTVLSPVVDHIVKPPILVPFWRSVPTWPFYGGITEEILMKPFPLSGAAYLLVKLGLGHRASLWPANVASVPILGALHLPTASRMGP